MGKPCLESYDESLDCHIRTIQSFCFRCRMKKNNVQLSWNKAPKYFFGYVPKWLNSHHSEMTKTKQRCGLWPSCSQPKTSHETVLSSWAAVYKELYFLKNAKEPDVQNTGEHWGMVPCNQRDERSTFILYLFWSCWRWRGIFDDLKKKQIQKHKELCWQHQKANRKF